MLNNRYGGFIDDGAAYEITDPGTPSPWTNVVSNGRYGFVVSQNGGGFSWLDHCQLNVVTRWDMDHVRDDRGRFLLVRDLDGDADHQTWSLSPQPCRPRYDHFRCVHRAGMTSFETACNGIAAAWDLAVTPDDTAEVWRVTLTNESGRERRIRLGAYFEWCCGTAPDVKREFHRLFFTTTHDKARRAIVATKNMWEAPFGTADDHWNRPWPHAAAFAISGVDSHWATADKAAFLGRYGAQGDPAGMRELAEGRFGRFVDACSALGADLTLAPGESRTVCFTLAVDDNPEAVTRLIEKYSEQAEVDRAFETAAASWRSLLAGTRAKTGMPDLDLLANHWLPYQAISARLWARTGYYQQSGAFGFRDQLQDSQLWLLYAPERCRDQILLHAAHQFADGSVYHWWNPITETGQHDACSDDYLWLPFVTASYIRETGDAAVLDERIRFVDDEEGATLAEHGLRSIRRAWSRRTERGLPLIGANDWNDGLSHVGTDDAGESIWLAFFLHDVLNEFAPALEARGDKATARELRAMRDEMRKAVNAHGWDGSWFRRATDRDGRWLGSSESAEGKLFLNPQTWAILGGAASGERCDAAWASVRRELVQDYGVLLLAPAYTVPDAKIGYLSRYAPGSRENGGVYMHAATWALAAACKRRDRETVERIWRGVSPPLRARDADAYVAEPYVTPGNVDGPLSDTPGRAGWTWYTGSAAWLHRVAVEWVLGVRACWEGLKIDPCPIAEMGQVEVTRLWRDRTVRVRYDARAYEPTRSPVVEVAGREIEGNVIDEKLLDRLSGESGLPPEGEIEVRVRWVESPTPEIKVRSVERSRA
ncbi:MAG: glycosyl transferase family 36 [Phycisphaeraceae bacterium]|nr:MAG: glycosyl transferase family 36 [Phycisphaeraceae bacterium]